MDNHIKVLINHPIVPDIGKKELYKLLTEDKKEVINDSTLKDG